MNQPATKPRISVQDYLAGEKDGEMRHEYIGGEVYAMTGASDRHALIVGAFYAALRPAARQKGCQLFVNDMKVHIRQAGEDNFYYPDPLLACDPVDRAAYYREKPSLIVEVLSDGTERIDRREKLFAYTGVASLLEYVLVAQDRRQLDIYRRTGRDWAHERVQDGTFRIESLELEVPVEAVYEDIAPESPAA
jgi:Uma2 family endonuclease